MARNSGADDVIIVDHDGNFIKLVINDSVQLNVGSSEVHVPGTLVLSGTLNSLTAITGAISSLTASVGALNATGDITAAGGMRQDYQFYIAHLKQGQTAPMTCSQMTSAFGARLDCTTIPMFAPTGGTVLGYSITTTDGSTITAGAVTSSVDIAGVSVLKTAWNSSTGGTLGQYSNKDSPSLTFLNGQQLGATISASADYTNSLATSASFVINIILEA